jgi:hypothetical protein
MNIVSLKDRGHKIVDLCSLTDKKLFDLVNEWTQEQLGSSGEKEFFVTQLIAAGMEYDEAGFDKLFSHCLLRFGVKDSYSQIIHPLLQRLGMMWAGNQIHPAYEHFICNLIRKKLLTAIDALPAPKLTNETWLLFLPENEFHEIGLLLSSYLIQLSGRKVIYLGANLPLSSILLVSKEASPQKLLTFFVHHDDPTLLGNFMNDIGGISPRKKIYVATHPGLPHQVPQAAKVHWLHCVEDLERELIA